MEVIVGVTVLKGKGLGGLAQADAEQAVHLVQHLGLAGAQGVEGLPFPVQLAQDAGVLPQFLGQGRIHLAAGGGGFGLRVGRLGHHAVLFDQAAQHIPLAAIAHGRGEQVGHQTAAGGLLQRFENAFEEVVGFFQLIPEEEVCLRELKGLEAAFPHHLIAQGVEGSEHPAAAALLLVADIALLQADRVLVHVVFHGPALDGGGQQAVVRHSVHGHAVGPLGRKAGVKGFELFFRDFLRHRFYVLSMQNFTTRCLPRPYRPPGCAGTYFPVRRSICRPGRR